MDELFEFCSRCHNVPRPPTPKGISIIKAASSFDSLASKLLRTFRTLLAWPPPNPTSNLPRYYTRLGLDPAGCDAGRSSRGLTKSNY